MATKKEQEIYARLLAETDGDKTRTLELFIRYKCITDLYFLSSEILGLNIAKEGKRKRLDRVFHKYVCKALQEEKDSLLIVPRGHMKSTFAKIRVIQMLLKNPLIRVGLFSRTSGLAESQLQEIKQLMATPLLRRYFSDIIPDPGKNYSGWERSTLSELTISRKREWGRIPQENQIEAWGSTATVTGRHYDVIVMDDIINEQSCSTPEQIRKARDFYSYLQSIKEPDGWEYVIGTRYHFNDLYGTIMKNGWFGRRVYVRSAIEDGRPIYRFFTLAMLEKIRKRQGIFEFSCQYMNNPIPAEEQIFPPPYPTFVTLAPDEYEYYVSMDPAATTQSWSDQTAITVCAVNRLGHMFVVESLGIKKPPNEVADIFIQKLLYYKPVRSGVELGLQAALGYIIQSKLNEIRRQNDDVPVFDIVGITVPRNISKADRINKSLGSFIRDGRLFIKEGLGDLMLQMEFFPKGEHDDLIDSLSMQFAIIDDFGSRYLPTESWSERKGKSFFDMFATKKDYSWENQFIG